MKQLHINQRVIVGILFSCLLFSSCGNSNSKKTAAPYIDELSKIGQVALDALNDSSTTWSQIKEAFLPLVDAITDAASDESNLKRRMAGQEFGYMFMESAIDKYLELKDAGQIIPDEEINSIISPIQGALNCWFYESSEELPHLWKDHYYVSNKNAEEPVNGYFHIMVTLPTKGNSEPSLHIFYPESAESSPALIFHEDPTAPFFDADYDLKNLIQLNDWFEKNENGDGMPMAATAGNDVVQKMLTYPVVYLLFRSSRTENGEPGELEVARLHLEPLQILRQEVVHER